MPWRHFQIGKYVISQRLTLLASGPKPEPIANPRNAGAKRVLTR
jgi:hypothetical protein